MFIAACCVNIMMHKLGITCVLYYNIIYSCCSHPHFYYYQAMIDLPNTFLIESIQFS